MATLFILNVPEFEPLLLSANADPAITVREVGNYTRLFSPGELRLLRADTHLGKAVWYGALTGGYLGRVSAFDDDLLVIVDD